MQARERCTDRRGNRVALQLAGPRTHRLLIFVWLKKCQNPQRRKSGETRNVKTTKPQGSNGVKPPPLRMLQAATMVAISACSAAPVQRPRLCSCVPVCARVGVLPRPGQSRVRGVPSESQRGAEKNFGGSSSCLRIIPGSDLPCTKAPLRTASPCDANFLDISGDLVTDFIMMCQYRALQVAPCREGYHCTALLLSGKRGPCAHQRVWTRFVREVGERRVKAVY